MDQAFSAIPEIFRKNPHYQWLPFIQLHLGARGRASQDLRMSLDLPYPVSAIEEALLFRPYDYARWVDPDIQKGKITAHPNWPFEGRVAYEYPSSTRWLLPPFAKFNQGQIEIRDWTRGAGFTMVDQTEPHRVLTIRRFRYESLPESDTTRLSVDESSEVRGFLASRLLGWAIVPVIALEAVKSLCEFTVVLSELEPASAGIVPDSYSPVR